jgi:hypothetical protein
MPGKTGVCLNRTHVLHFKTNGGSELTLAALSEGDIGKQKSFFRKIRYAALAEPYQPGPYVTL